MLEMNAIEDFNKRRGGPKEVYFTKLVKNIIDLAYHSQFETKKKCRWLREQHQRIHTWISEKETSQRNLPKI